MSKAISFLRSVGRVLTFFIATAVFLFSSSYSAIALQMDGQLIAAARSDVDVIQYPGPDATNTNELGPIDQQVFERDAQQIPAQRQPITNPSNPDARLLEKVGEQFSESTNFVKGLQQKAGEEATERERERRGK